MKHEEKAYEKEVCVPHVWELIKVEGEIEPQTVLIATPVSKYIRSLEEDLKTTRRLLAEKLKESKK